MTTTETAAYRTAAAKLAEALATKDREQAYLAAVNALVPLDPGGELESTAYRGLSVCSDWATYRINSRGWRWITEAARLRLLLEATLAEQGERAERVGAGYRDCLRADGACCGCGAPTGALHAAGCDQERCAICHGQRIGCDCDFAEILTVVEEFKGPRS